MKILWLTENYYPQQGGMAQSCDRISHGLRQAGVTVDILHFSNSSPAYHKTEVEGGSLTTLPVYEDSAHSLHLAWNYIKRKDFPKDYTHLLVFGGNLPMLIAPLFQKWLALPLLTCLRGNDFDVSIFNPKKRGILKDCLLSSTQVCTVTSDKARYVNNWLGDKRAVFTPNGQDLESWKAFEEDYTDALYWRKQNVVTHKRVIGIVGHLKKKKGIEFFIQNLMIGTLKEEVHLLIVGDLSRSCMELLRHSGISHSLIPFVQRYELIPYYLACDIIALPSHYDGMPNVLLEAGALERPFIASQIDGMADFITEGEQGFLFHPGDADSCRRALFRFQQSSLEELQAMGKKSKVEVEHKYTSEQEINRYLGILKDTLSQ